MLDTTIEGKHIHLFKKVNILLEEKEEGNHCNHVLNIWVEYNEGENYLSFLV